MSGPVPSAAAAQAQAAGAGARSPPSPPSSVSQWVSQHRRLVVALAAAATVTTAGALYYSHASRQQAQQQAKKDKQARKDAKRGKKSQSGQDSNTDTAATAGSQDKGSAAKEPSDDALKLSSTDIEVMDAQTALSLKARGNKLYASKQYDEAIAYYTKAIECEEQAVFYSNRAACYTNLNKLDKVVEDCSAALRLDSQYVKALNRRATAREQMGGQDSLYLSLCDFTAAAILDGFQNQSTSTSVERVMKRLASEKAADMLATREPRLPSATFVTAYLTAFRPRPAPTLPASPQQGDRTLQLAFEALDAKDFAHAFSLFNEALEQGVSTDEARAEALNMRATFKFIMSDAVGALKDLDEATTFKADNAQSWVKKASVHMELGKPEEAMSDFDRALQIDPENADVFYHRGQVFFITGEFDRAIQEYRRSSELDPSYIFCHIQLAVAQYKAGSTQKALALFDRLVEKNPKNADVRNYYGELLLDQQRFQDAVDAFDKAIEFAKDQTPRNVLPMVNKALAIFQHRQDFATAERICREAVTIDPQCDVGVATLAQLLLQQNKVHEAVDMFSKAAEMARTEPELVNALTYENATRAQLAFLRDYPEQASRLGLARTA